MADLSTWRGSSAPNLADMRGAFVRVTPFEPAHADPLHRAAAQPEDGDLWRYLPTEPPETAAGLGAFLTMMAASPKHEWRTHVFFAPDTDQCLGMASYMRIRPEHGSAEVGMVLFSRAMQRTPAATEAMYVMARHVFEDLGYRRYEWKCNNANAASKRAAVTARFHI